MAENDVNKAAADARQADADARKARATLVQKQTEQQRKAIDETLNEQANSKPVPSQEHANLMRAGAYDPLSDAEEVEQPDGPARRASEGNPDVQRAAVADANAANYQTRSATAESGTAEPASGEVRRGPGRPRSQ